MVCEKFGLSGKTNIKTTTEKQREVPVCVLLAGVYPRHYSGKLSHPSVVDAAMVPPPAHKGDCCYCIMDKFPQHKS
jgi:hypothetical protein